MLLCCCVVVLLLLFGDGSDMNCVYVFTMCVLLVFNAAVQSKGYSGAEIASICREAALNAIEEDENAAVVKQVHFTTALDNIAPQTTPNMLLFYEQFGSSNK